MRAGFPSRLAACRSGAVADGAHPSLPGWSRAQEIG